MKDIKKFRNLLLRQKAIALVQKQNEEDLFKTIDPKESLEKFIECLISFVTEREEGSVSIETAELFDYDYQIEITFSVLPYDMDNHRYEKYILSFLSPIN